MLWFLIWVCCAIGASAIANEKNRSWVDWLIIGFLLGPFAVLIIGFMPTWYPPVKQKKCPFCAELIKQDAIVCKHCGKDISIDGLKPLEDKDNLKFKKIDHPCPPYYKQCPKCLELSLVELEECPKCGFKEKA